MTEQGFYSDFSNFGYFTECLDSWLKAVPGTKLGSDTAYTLRLIFKSAQQAGVYSSVTRKLSWKEKLWVLATYWELQVSPWAYDECTDPPDILDLNWVLPKIQKEAQAHQTRDLSATQQTPDRSLDMSRFIRPQSLFEPKPLAPKVDTPVESEARDSMDLTRFHEQIIEDTDRIIEQEGPSPYIRPPACRPTPEESLLTIALPSARSQAIKKNLLQTLAQQTEGTDLLNSNLPGPPQPKDSEFSEAQAPLLVENHIQALLEQELARALEEERRQKDAKLSQIQEALDAERKARSDALAEERRLREAETLEVRSALEKKTNLERLNIQAALEAEQTRGKRELKRCPDIL